MPKITISDSELGKRGSKVAKLLRPILADQRSDPVAYSTHSGPGQEYFIIARDKIITSDFTKWRFATIHKDFRGNYFEKWIPVIAKSHEKWYLLQAYLTIYYIDRGIFEEKEFLSLHTDPEEPDSPVAIYKRNPHLHIKSASNPIPKSHITITIGSMRDVLTSSQTIFDAMKHGMELIRDEILARYK